MMHQVRCERPDDRCSIEVVHRQAFPTESEALLVELLRDEATPIISLVAEQPPNGIVGHVLFTPVILERDADREADLPLMGLAPLGVVPDHQRKGIGTALVRAGLHECARSGVGAVVVLGDPEYYARFGFKPARLFQITSEYASAGDAFMILELKSNYLEKMSGRVKYHSAFRRIE